MGLSSAENQAIEGALPEEKKTFCGKIKNCTKNMSKENLIKFLESVFFKYALFVDDHPWKFIVGTFVVCIALSCGIMLRQSEADMFKLYTLRDSNAAQIRADLDKTFEAERNIFIIVNSYENILSKRVLLEMQKFNDGIYNLIADIKDIDCRNTKCDLTGLYTLDQIAKEFYINQPNFIDVEENENATDVKSPLNDRYTTTDEYNNERNEHSSNNLNDDEIAEEDDDFFDFDFLDEEEEEEKENIIPSHVKDDGKYYYYYYYNKNNMNNDTNNNNNTINISNNNETNEDLNVVKINKKDLIFEKFSKLKPRFKNIKYTFNDVCMKDGVGKCKVSTVFDAYPFPTYTLGKPISASQYPNFMNLQTNKLIRLDGVFGNSTLQITPFNDKSIPSAKQNTPSLFGNLNLKKGTDSKQDDLFYIQSKAPQDTTVLRNATAFLWKMSSRGSKKAVPFTLLWELHFANFVKNYKVEDTSLPPLYFTVFTERCIEDELYASSRLDMDAFLRLLVGVIMLLCYTIFVTYSSNPYFSKMMPAAVGLFSGLLAYTTAAGFLYISGLLHVPPAETTPFLVFGIVLDDIFVILNSYSLGSVCRKSRTRIALTLRDAGLAITITTSTNLIPFIVGSLSPFFSIVNFSIVTGVSLLFGYILCLTLFFPFLCLDARREYARRKFYTCKEEKKATSLSDDEIDDEIAAKFSIYELAHKLVNLYEAVNRIKRKEKKLKKTKGKKRLTDGSNSGENDPNVTHTNIEDDKKKTPEKTRCASMKPLFLLNIKKKKQFEEDFEKMQKKEGDNNNDIDNNSDNNKEPHNTKHRGDRKNERKKSQLSNEEYKKKNKNSISGVPGCLQADKNDVYDDDDDDCSSSSVSGIHFIGIDDDRKFFHHPQHHSYSLHHRHTLSSKGNNSSSTSMNDIYNENTFTEHSGEHTLNEQECNSLDRKRRKKYSGTRQVKSSANSEEKNVSEKDSDNDIWENIEGQNTRASRGGLHTGGGIAGLECVVNVSDYSFDYSNRHQRSNRRNTTGCLQTSSSSSSSSAKKTEEYKKQTTFDVNSESASYVAGARNDEINNDKKTMHRENSNSIKNLITAVNASKAATSSISNDNNNFNLDGNLHKQTREPSSEKSSIAKKEDDESMSGTINSESTQSKYTTKKKNEDIDIKSTQEEIELASKNNTNINDSTTSIDKSSSDGRLSNNDTNQCSRLTNNNSNNDSSILTDSAPLPFVVPRNSRTYSRHHRHHTLEDIQREIQCYEPDKSVGKSFRILIIKYYASLLDNKIAKVCVLLFFLSFFSYSLYRSTLLNSGLTYYDVIPSRSSLGDFYDNRIRYFSTYGEEVVVFFNKPMDLWKPSVHEEVYRANALMENGDYAAFVNNGFYRFLNYYERNYDSQAYDKEQFYTALLDWLDNNAFGRNYKNDFIFGDDGEIKAWRFTYFLKYTDVSSSAWRWLKQCRDDVAILQGECYYFAAPVTEVDPMIVGYTLQNMAVALGAVVIISTLVIPSVLSAVLVVVIILMIDVCLFGAMSLWSVNLNLVSMVNLIISTGFSIDHTAHVIHAFAHCVGRTRAARMIECLVVIGTPVMHSALTTWLAIACLCTSDKGIIVIFFKMITMVLMFSLAHGVVLLPVVLSLIGPMYSITPPQINSSKSLTRK